MNCANHPNVPATAYCRTCGKPLCANCARDVRGVVYCENCLAERVEGTATVPGPAGAPIPQSGGSGPNPVLAGLLGAIPFGVGAVYNGQYAKGLAHLVIFCLLVVGANHAGEPLDTFFGLGIAFFVLYQIIDAVRTARAIQLGLPAPDPLGLGQAFGAGEKFDTSRTPKAAIILIGLGLLFFLQTSGIFNLSFDRTWPAILVALGVWLLIRRLGTPGYADGTRKGSFTGPAVLLTIGVLVLIQNFHGLGFERTWPVLLLAVGLAKLFDHRAAQQFPVEPNVALPANSLSEGTQPPAPPSSEVKNG